MLYWPPTNISLLCSAVTDEEKKRLSIGRPGKASRRSLEHRQGSGVPDEEVSGQEQAHGRLETRL